MKMVPYRTSAQPRRNMFATSRLAALLVSTSGLELPVLPFPSASMLLPGESRRVLLKEPAVKVLDASPCVGQLLTMPSGDGFIAAVPIVKATHLEVSGDATWFTLTCIGRGLLQLPLLEGATGDSSSAHLAPFVDMNRPSESDSATACAAIRSRYASCRALSARVLLGGGRVSPSGGAVARLFNNSLGDVLAQKRDTLRMARKGASVSELQLHTASLEAELPLLTNCVAGILDPEERLHALACRDGSKRLPYSERNLRGFEQRLAAEVALQEWDLGCTGVYGDDGFF